jgi:hypothetical protein
VQNHSKKVVSEPDPDQGEAESFTDMKENCKSNPLPKAGSDAEQPMFPHPTLKGSDAVRSKKN